MVLIWNILKQGLTVIEAMAASLPVLAVNDDSFRIVVTDELNGYLFEDKQEYIKKVDQLVSHPKTLSKMSKQARMSAETHSSKHFAERVLDVYKIAIANHGETSDSLVGTIERVIKRGFYGI